MPPFEKEHRWVIGELLRARVKYARAQYEALRAQADELRDTAGACVGTPDGTLALQRFTTAQQKINDALAAYQRAVAQLTEYVVSGKVPPEIVE